MATTGIKTPALREGRPRLVGAAGFVIVLLLGAGVAWAWKSLRPPAPAATPVDWNALDKALLAAIRAGDHHQVEALLEQGAAVEARDEGGNTALMQAAINADAEMMQLLLARGAQVNARARDGSTVLVRAVHDPGKVRLLLAHGAGVDDEAMYLAASVAGSAATLDLLLRHGGNVNGRTRGLTPLMGAAFCGDLDSVMGLLRHGADAKARAPSGYTPVHGAAYAGNAAILKRLLDGGADPNVRYVFPDSDGDIATPVMIAALLGHAECLHCLLDAGADVNVQEGPFERTALLGAATQGKEEVVQLLLARGAAVNAEDSEGNTPLAWARRRGETAIVKLLRRAGAREPDPPRPARTRSPLHKRIDAGSVQRAVAASLPPLQRSGERIRQRRGCATCHQHALVAMTVGLARQRGLAADEALAARARAGVYADLRPRLPWLLLGTGIDPTMAAYALVGFAALDQEPSRFTDALVHYLVLRQRNDGRWRTEVYRPPEDSSDFLFTALAVRGLQAYAPPGRRREIAGHIARARSWLMSTPPTETVDQVFQLLGLRWCSAPQDAVQQATGLLLREQRPDGGWAQLPTLPSDAYATGQVLYALHEGGGIPVDHPAYRRGVAFLLRTQLADGSWFVPTRCFPLLKPFTSGFPHGRSQFISAAATCWATMALTLTVPARDPPRTVAAARPMAPP